MSAYYNLKAIILKRQDFREDDLLIAVYSKEKGKAILQAKGAKKILSKLAGHLEPVTLSYLNITYGKQIDQLIGAQIIKSYAKIKSDIQLTAYAYYFIELIDRLTKEDHADQNIFQLLEKSLDFLNANQGELKIARISFGYKLLHFLGFNPAQKEKLKNGIEYIIKNNIKNIIKNNQINQNLVELNKILDQELENNLETAIKTKEFLRCLKS
ncbi:DNA repair protein RecO [Candidatus Kuenenbacteria bacterium CG_4_9_14_3_um_filter_39_14]|uniref:DNA repair protein RecO n=6 Tax=Candidatus Kueneniibacteriota TaxID=1752740 RepID=A0A2M7ILX2_9BACT|nr:DNA repair protein RecO [Candidatus Kuenenbacteria bacterium]PIP29003.1 MAG: DNA repair protein RecO [Candidatus Kuenenbacteria bacterium CG23_combo_of_CG06-09_8_20_14_all_39_39]PIP75174.1 MAG: DNA repair protein RecO [Candidatus Kuenenbacteria bacterium CG22_combo_CG10-13_8_21_14_all_39_9]PIR80783.1 MAG: DNA repair protein RecO [Candidatus Kuenenbacteria bacterium CG10_big_fil_rev_8_21_14_0_10_39_14]PIW95832.1 MAG: DNA repair protein RecO [Candidatus Kuenenbacteria bacterium CG_4_8_14_3_um_